jgi:glucose/arabinose dehydrogenase
MRHRLSVSLGAGRTPRLLIVLGLVAMLHGMAALAAPARVDEQQVASLRLPPGFHINVFAEGLGYVRFMTFRPQGDLVASSSSRENYGDTCGGGSCPANDGRIFILPDRERRGMADQVTVFADGLDRPHGVAYRDGVLWVAEHSQVVRLPDPAGPGAPEDFITGWLRDQPVCNNRPNDAGRDTAVCRADAWGRPVGLAVGPDGTMYLSDDLAGVIYRITYTPAG